MGELIESLRVHSPQLAAFFGNPIPRSLLLAAGSFIHAGFQSGAEALGFVRPHELDIETDLAGSAGIVAKVERVLAFGPTARVELTGAEREASRIYEVELSRERVAALNLANGQRVRLKPARIRLFAPDPRPAGATSLPARSLIGLDGEGI